MIPAACLAVLVWLFAWQACRLAAKADRAMENEQ